VDAIVREALSTIEGSALEKAIALAPDLPDGLEPISADATRLKQVLINLLGNAVKFTESGRITVRVSTVEGTRRPGQIEVSDTGIGIAPEKLDGIFDAFQQADSSTTRKYGGTGLGLAISRSLCRLMGFDLTVASEIDRGSTFTVVLDSVLSAKPRAEAGEPAIRG